ncbi:hypothetical protein [Bartonella sp. AD13SXNS]|uniref:hypothetical protein n=1 Tax=Bartonella sp. AD13SXNS TaxID=3243462 RepID=UPI0035D11A77
MHNQKCAQHTVKTNPAKKRPMSGFGAGSDVFSSLKERNRTHKGYATNEAEIGRECFLLSKTINLKALLNIGK